MIKVLDNNLINKIAAGEVVERPASVIKELVENSIDAGAKNIVVEIEKGGKTLIKIIDNGSGIPAEEVKTAFLRHATSKIANIDDLTSVLSLGFRGEALSSISSVAQVEIVTKTKNETVGQKLIINGGQIISEESIGTVDGTTMVVRNLFYNVPAREKFLKKESSESAFISEIITKIALGHPEIAFKFVNNKSVMLQTNGNSDLKAAVLSVYGMDIASKLLDVSLQGENIAVTGYICDLSQYRSNRNYGNIFINGRYIKSELIQSAIEKAYKTKLPIGKFPIYILNLDILPTEVDVNVHPTKLEVRFKDEDYVYDFIFNAVEKILKEVDYIPKLEFQSESKVILNENVDTIKEKVNIADLLDEEKNPNDYKSARVENFSYENKSVAYEGKENSYGDKLSVGDFENNNAESLKPRIADIIIGSIPRVEKQKEVEPVKTVIATVTKQRIHDRLNNYKIVGQVFGTYWMIEAGDSLFMLDQHAAHERIIYEELKYKYNSYTVTSQMLLQPLSLVVSQKEANLIEDNLDLLNKLGFEIEEFGVNVYALRSVPYIFNNPANANFFLEILDELDMTGSKEVELYNLKLEKIISMSCKAAVKANDRLSVQEARELVETVVRMEDPFTCPHGRPILIELPKYELEKKFKRS